MRQRFFTNTIQSKFIKSLIYNTPLPNYETINIGDYIINNNIYIYKKLLLKCVNSGYYGKDAKVKKIGDYNFGFEYKKFTERHISTANYYDTKTHINLGHFLRCYRDIYDIDLMPFYNCYSGEDVQGLLITDDGISVQKNVLNKVIKIPIAYNKTYTISIDSNSEIYIASALLDQNNPLEIYDKNNKIKINDLLREIPNNYMKFPFMSFETPKKYKLDISSNQNKELLYNYRKDLYLLIQIPLDNKSSIVVLEGDYERRTAQQVFDISVVDKLNIIELNKLLLSDLSLLQINDGVNYPFSDRLIEYLLWNVITSQEEIVNNIKRIQEKLDKKQNGVWDNLYRVLLYKSYINSNYDTKLDINGFVDKNMENYLIRRM